MGEEEGEEENPCRERKVSLRGRRLEVAEAEAEAEAVIQQEEPSRATILQAEGGY